MTEADHLSAETLGSFLGGQLAEAERTKAEIHLDQCADCRRVLSDLARSEPPTPVTEPQLDLALLPPTRLGRYLVLGRLGSGGMGVVWEGYDPSLNRKVAIKVLKRARFGEPGKGSEHRARFIREAQSMALLSHPNVAQVYDIGEAEEDVFIAIELLTGGTLRQWLKTDPPISQVLEKFFEAGRGLAAAHAAGLVHRDFKPDNVLLGVDGHAKVTDFGLARAEGEPMESAEASGSFSPIVPLESVTVTGEQVVGTPKYMSPEQRRGESLDARSDMYSYCLALQEALKRGADGVLPPEVPVHVRRALERGLASVPAERFGSMEKLLDALQPPLSRSWPLPLAVALGLALIAGGSGALRQYRLNTGCRTQAGRMTAVWNAEAETAVRAAFDATGSPLADELFARAKRGLDEYGTAWAQVSEHVCRAKSVEGQQCVEARLGRATAAVAGLRTVTAADIDRVPDIINALPLAQPCGDAAYLRGTVLEPPPPAQAEAVKTARSFLDQALVADVLGRRAQATELLASAEKAVKDLGFLPVDAEVAALSAQLETTYVGQAEAEAHWIQALALSSAANHRAVLARSWIGLSESFLRQQRFGEAEMASLAALRALETVALAPERLQVMRLASNLALRQGHPEEALLKAEECVVTAVSAFGEQSLATARCEEQVGSVLNMQSRPEDGIAHFIRAAEMQEHALSPNHPTVGKAWSYAGNALCQAGRVDEGLAATRKGLAIARRTLAPDSPDLALRLTAVSGCLMQGDGRSKDQPELMEAVAIVEKRPELEHYLNVISTAGWSRFFQGRYAESCELFSKGLSTLKSKSKNPYTFFASYGLGRCKLAVGEVRAARQQLTRAVELAYSDEFRTETGVFLALAEWKAGDHTGGLTRFTTAFPLLENVPTKELVDEHAYEAAQELLEQDPELQRAVEGKP